MRSLLRAIGQCVRPRKALVCAILLLVSVCFYRLIRVTNNDNNGQPSLVNPLKNDSRLILAWTTKSGKSKWIPNTLRNLDCEVSNCLVSEDRSRYAQADAVIFHAKDITDDDLPGDDVNRSNKVWVLLNHEPPPHTPRHIYSFMNSLIDWTISYRRDSTIFAPIYELRRTNRRSASYKQPPKRDKRKVAAWLVSHCKTSSNREGFVAELRKNLPVEIWGKCGRKLTSCPPNSRSGCYGLLSRKYKFYLSLENSLCQDYVTEKAFLALKSGMVPIVFGGADYNKFLPPGSYIDALSFESVSSLGKHVQRVSRDRNAILKYLEWNREYEIVERRYKWLCDLCKKLNQWREKKDERPDLLEWWYADSKCQQWRNGTFLDYN